jgi:glucose dehydrogenase
MPKKEQKGWVEMNGQNTANILLFLGVVLSALGIILISSLGRPSYIIIGAGAVLMIVSWIVKRRRP